ncbi:MAG: NPCBM/NEW2 domain-containing protein [Thermoguttaceae bacterium]
MAGAFDPYHQWLGIPPSEQPPDHYRLLGLVRYESDPEVIDNAASQRMAHLRSFQSGSHAAQSQKLLNELAAARVCLLNLGKKAAYDERLRLDTSPPVVALVSPARPSRSPTTVLPAPPPLGLQRQIDDAGTRTGPPIRPVSRRLRLLLACSAALVGLVVGLVLFLNARRSSDSVLVIDLADADRGDVSVSIDGTPRAIPSAGPLELSCPPGSHEVVAVRRGYPPFSTTVHVAARRRLTVRVQWNPTAEDLLPLAGPAERSDASGQPQTVAAASPPADPSMPVAEAVSSSAEPPAAPPTTAPLPVPPADEQARMLAHIDEAFAVAEAGTAGDRAQLAARLLDSSQQPSADPSNRYGMLLRAGTLALDAHDLPLALQIVAARAEQFAIEPLAERAQVLSRFAAAAEDAPIVEAILAAGDQLLDAAAEAGRHDLALQLLAAFQAEIDRKTSWQPCRQRVAGRLVFQQALADLQARPDDPQANAVAGRWYLVDAQLPEKAFPCLVKIGHEGLRSLAAIELTPPASPQQQAALGDGWWDQAESTADASLKQAFRARAAHWYRQAAPALASTDSVAKIAARLGQLDSTALADAGPRTEPDSLPPGRPVEKNTWIDLLPAVHLARDVVRGQWRRQGNLIATAAERSALVLPVAVRGDYELELQFSLVGGPPQGLTLALPVGLHACGVFFPFNERTDVLAAINGQPYVAQVARLEPGRFVTARVRVATEAAGRQITVLVNGGPYFQWQGDESLLAPNALAELPDSARPGLMNLQETFAFQAVRFQLLDGEARLVFAGASPSETRLLVPDVGSPDGTAFQDLGPPGMALVGLRYSSPGFGLAGLQPVYRSPDGQLRDGASIGAIAPLDGSVLAREGYAVAALAIETQNRSLAGLVVRFGRLVENRLDLADTYDSPLIGQAGVNPPALVETRGRLPLGLHGLWNPGQIASLGLVLASPAEQDLWQAISQDRRQFLTLLDLEPIQSTVAGTGYARGLHAGMPDPSAWPILDESFQFCPEYLYAPAPSRLAWKLPSAMKSFSAVGYCVESRSVRFRVLVDAKAVFDSQQAGVVPIRVDLPPGEQLELQVDHMADGQRDESFWLFPRLHPRPADSLKEFDEKDPRSKPLGQLPTLLQTITPSNPPNTPLLPVYPVGEVCREFLYAHPPSRLVYRVPKGAKRFSAVGYCIASKSVRFRVSINGNEVFAAGPAGIQKIQLALPRQAATLELSVEPAPEAHVSAEDIAFWCFPRFYR